MYYIREMMLSDLNYGFAEALQPLTDISNISVSSRKEKYRKRFNSKNIVTLVAVDSSSTQVLGTLTILFEPRYTGLAAHIEDVSVGAAYQGQGIGKNLMRYAINLCKCRSVYKIVLSAAKKVVPFYESLGFKKSEVTMRLDL